MKFCLAYFCGSLYVCVWGEGDILVVKSCCVKCIASDELFSYLALHMNIKQVVCKACFKFE